jgi:hypothetical protein
MEGILLRFLFGVFIILHGLVHLLYFGQSQRLFELRPGMVWPDSSWIFSRFLGVKVIRSLASIALVLTAFGFITGGVGILMSFSWELTIILGASVFSSLVYIFFWDGNLQKLDDQGGIGVLINIAIILAVFRIS